MKNANQRNDVSPLSVMVTADDLGIAPQISETIIRLGEQQMLTHASLMVNSPWTEHGVGLWKAMEQPVALCLHLALTIDQPLSAPQEVASLIDPRTQRFWKLAPLTWRAMTGKIVYAELVQETRQQIIYFHELTGRYPVAINTHHHIHALPLIGRAIEEACASLQIKPWLRQLGKAASAISRRRLGEYCKWQLLSSLHRRPLRQAPLLQNVAALPFQPGDEHCLKRGLTRAYRGATGAPIEIIVHPGEVDAELYERDVKAGHPWHARREVETAALESQAIATLLASVPAAMNHDETTARRS